MTGEPKERRKHTRHGITCPAVITDSQGRRLAKAATIDLSDGGACLTADDSAKIPPAGKIRIKLSIPRQTANTFMYEPLECEANIVRHESKAGQAMFGIRFGASKPLMLDV